MIWLRSDCFDFIVPQFEIHRNFTILCSHRTIECTVFVAAIAVNAAIATTAVCV